MAVILGWGLVGAAAEALGTDLTAADGSFALRGEVVEAGRNSVGGDFALEARDPELPALRGGELALRTVAVNGLANRSAGGCPCGAGIFTDGFESGDTAAWSSAAP